MFAKSRGDIHPLSPSGRHGDYIILVIYIECFFDGFSVYVFKQESKYAYKCEIRSCVENSSRPSSTMSVDLMAKAGSVS